MILAIFDRIREGVAADTFAHVHGIVEATKQAFLVRNRHVCDPDVDARERRRLSARRDARRTRSRHRCRDGRAPGRSRPIKGDTVWMGAVDGDGCW